MDLFTQHTLALDHLPNFPSVAQIHDELNRLLSGFRPDHLPTLFQDLLLQPLQVFGQSGQGVSLDLPSILAQFFPVGDLRHRLIAGVESLYKGTAQIPLQGLIG